MIEFFVPGKPQGKGRPRFSMRGGYPRAYTPEQTRQYEKDVREAAILARKDRPALGGAVKITIRAAVQIPESWSEKKKKAASARDVPAIVKPDADNIAKAICDALEGIAYLNDKQVIDVHVIKEYGDTVGVSVTVEEAGK